MASSKTFTIFTKFAVKNGFSGPVLSMAKGADKMAARVDKAAKATKAFGGGVMAVGKFAAGAGLAVAAAGAAAFKLAEGSARAADDILNTASALGISTKALQEYRYVGIQAGLTTEEMDAALRKLTVNLGKDSADVENALYQVGLTADQLKAAGPERSLELIANGFKSIQDPTTKAAVATALFGKSSIRMVNALSGGSDAIAKLRGEAQEVGYVMSGAALDAAGEFDDTLDKLGATLTGVSNRMAARAIPGMTKFAASLQKGLQPGGRLSNLLDSLGATAGKVGDFIGPIFDTVADNLPKIMNFVGGLFNAIQPVLKPLLGILEPIFKIFENLMPLITGLVNVVSSILAPILETIKFILEGVASLTSDTSGSGIRGAGMAPAGGGLPGSGATRFPVSPNAGVISSSTTTTNRSTVDVNLNGLPTGSSVKQTGNAPDVTLNTGSTIDWSPKRKR